MYKEEKANVVIFNDSRVPVFFNIFCISCDTEQENYRTKYDSCNHLRAYLSYEAFPNSHAGPRNRVEWFGTFLRFSKSDKFLPIRYSLRSSIQENRQNWPRARQSFHFQKFTGTFKINILENLQKPSLFTGGLNF